MLVVCLKKVNTQSKRVHKKGAKPRVELTTFSESKSKVFRRYYSRRIRSLQMAVIYFLYRGSGISLQPDYRVDL
jgi:hypothetical protein